MRQRFTRRADGRFELGLAAAERELLRSLPQQVQQLLADRAPAANRVFPVAYPDDPAAEAEYRQLMGPELLQSHRESLAVVTSTADADSIDGSELHCWMDGLEVLRLVLGTQLDVQEGMDLPTGPVDGPDADSPDAMRLAVYHYLTALQGEAVDALTSLLPDLGDPPEPG